MIELHINGEFAGSLTVVVGRVLVKNTQWEENNSEEL